MHKKKSAKMSIFIKLSRYSIETLSIFSSLQIIKNNKKTTIIKSLNFGLILIFKSSVKPNKKKNVQNDINSKKNISL